MIFDIGGGRFSLVVRVKVPVSEIRFDCWCWKAWGQIPVLDACHWSLLLLAWGLAPSGGGVGRGHRFFGRASG
jgi:hypothetical protein